MSIIQFPLQTDNQSAETLGRKTMGLLCSSVIFDHTPPFFVIPSEIVDQIAFLPNKKILTDLKTAYNEIKKNDIKNLIVRSSSSYENADLCTFSGVFKSVANVASFEELVAAVKECREYADAHSVKEYTKAIGTKLPPSHLSLIVQEQIRFDRTALVEIANNRVFIEEYDDELQDRIQGRGHPETVVLHDKGRTTILRSNSTNFNENIYDDLSIILSKIREDFERRKPNFAKIVLETGISDERLYVLQCNTYERCFDGNQPFFRILQQKPDSYIVKDLRRFGLKGSAMNYFKNNKMFNRKLFIFPYEKSIKDIENEINSIFKDNTRLTVRYSHMFEVGLPRSFQSDVRNVVDFISKTRRFGWTTIIHEYINVKRSFEVIITNDSLLIEHIPGMWESDNKLDPDVVYETLNGVKFWRCMQKRSARFIQNGTTTLENSNPVTFKLLSLWLNHAKDFVDIIRSQLPDLLPLNLHFIEDENGIWNFINIRSGFDVKFPVIRNGHPHVVSMPSDVDSWDRKSPILIKFEVDRGSEHKIISIANKINDTASTIIVDFGLLSHPAIVLRELGYRLIPSYLYSKRSIPSLNYKTRTVSYNNTSDFLTKLLNEPRIYEDDRTFCVADIDPVCNGHLLLFSKSQTRSFTDASCFLHAHKISRSSNKYFKTPMIFLERGRANFCSSMAESCIAHFHLIPCVEIDIVALQSFLRDTGWFVKSPANAETYFNENSNSEYFAIFFSNSCDVFCKLQTSNDFKSKRYIRHLIKQHLLTQHLATALE